jgi:transposase
MHISTDGGVVLMGRKSSIINLTAEDREYLEMQTRARTIQAQTVSRARILLLKADGCSIDDIADKVGINRKSVMLCLNKYAEGGVENALFDAPGRGRNAEITDDEKAWIINIACQKPIDFGYAAETWTYAKLTSHINKNAEAAGYTRLSTIHKSTVHSILDEAEIKPFRIKYYCENRDPDFDSKMHDVLLVYKQLSMQFDEDGHLIPWAEDKEFVHVLSYDEKPGIQATATTSEDLLPDERHSTISRDYEYKRLGTLSLLAGIDLQTGEAIPLVSETHNSKDYIEFLKILDSKYPEGDKIRIVLDNLKVHTSEETRKYLATVPGRFEFVFTPKHGSWLNMVEGFFGKMTKQMLRGIRVKSKAELVDRIYLYFAEVNAEPVVFHWKYNLDDIDVSEEIIVDTLLCKKSS